MSIMVFFQSHTSLNAMIIGAAAPGNVSGTNSARRPPDKERPLLVADRRTAGSSTAPSRHLATLLDLSVTMRNTTVAASLPRGLVSAPPPRKPSRTTFKSQSHFSICAVKASRIRERDDGGRLCSAGAASCAAATIDSVYRCHR